VDEVIHDKAKAMKVYAFQARDGELAAIELNGEDLGWAPLEHGKSALTKLLRQKRDGLVLNAHYDGDGAAIYQHACKLGCEGIVSKRLGSPYRSGRVSYWLKIKNPAVPAVEREAEEWRT
jgi:ATP-dependent DNA ligase